MINWYTFNFIGLPSLVLLAVLPIQSLHAQVHNSEVTSDVAGYVQVEAKAGVWADLAPIFYPPTSAAGVVGIVSGTGDERYSTGRLWSRSADPVPDPAASFIWPYFPTAAGLAGVPLKAERPANISVEAYDFWSTEWRYLRSDGTSLVTPNALLVAGNKLALNPYFLMEEITGPAANWETGTEFNYGSVTATAVSENGLPNQWQVGNDTGPGLKVADPWGPYQIKRPAGSTDSKNFVLTGTFRTGSLNREFLIRPGRKNMLFRPDGMASQPLLAAAGKLNLGTEVAVIASANLVAANVDKADKVRLYNRQTGIEETYFYKSVAQTLNPIGWFRQLPDLSAVRVTEAELAATQLPAGAVVSITRSSSTAAPKVIRLLMPTNPLITATAPNPILPKAVTSYDADIIPDFWESRYLPGSAAASSLWSADPDQDGFSNVKEWLLGGNPAVHDHPALLEVVPTSTDGRVTSVALAFKAAAGMKFRVETRLAEAPTWTPAVTGIVGTGVRIEYLYPIPSSEIANQSARFFRVVGMGPQDFDSDGLFDVEEWEVGTDDAVADTDGDGMSDGQEMMPTLKRNPLDYWDNAIFTFSVTGDRQVGTPNSWSRDPIKIKVTRALPTSPTVLIPLPKNLSVNFIMTRGRAKFAESPDAGVVDIKPSLNLKITPTDVAGKNGEAKCYVRLEAGDSLTDGSGLVPVQGLVSVRVDSDPINRKLYNESFTLYPSNHLIPPSGLLAWLRADRQVVVNAAGEVTRWGAAGFGAGVLPSYPGPKVFKDAVTATNTANRSWLRFTGAEALLLDDMVASSGAYSLLLSSRGTSAVVRTTAAVSTALPSNVGATGQFYAISGALPTGLPGLPMPYDDTTYRSFGLSLGKATAGLFELGSAPLSHSPSLVPSAVCDGDGVDGVLLALLTPALTAPSLRTTGKNAVIATGPLGNAPHFLPRMIGGRSGGASGTSGAGMFVGDLRDLLVFNRELTAAEAQKMEDIVTSEKASYIATLYKAMLPAINRDPGAGATLDALPDWWERTFWGNLSTSFNVTDADNDGLTNLVEYINGTHPLMLDTDGDGLTDGQEVNGWKHPGSTTLNKTSPVSWDSDNDLIPDKEDNLPLLASNGLNNTDGVGIGDGWDWLIRNVGVGTDSDGDGLSDLFEIAYLGTDPNVANIQDVDEDGIADWWEVAWFSDLDPPNDPYDPNETSSYPDGDGISDLEEFLLGLNPLKNDLGGNTPGSLIIETVIMDDQGRLKAVGTQAWGYDAEGSVTTKN